MSEIRQKKSEEKKEKPLEKEVGLGEKRKRRCKDKGPGFERTTCKLLHEWWGRGKFMRTKNLQVLSRDSRGLQGDVVCLLEEDGLPQLDPDFPFSVECKAQEGWDFADLLKDNKHGIYSFWIQCCADAKAWKKLPLLIFKRNNYGVYAAWQSTGMGCNEYVNIPNFTFTFKQDRFYIATWENFIKLYTPNHLKEETAC